MPEITISFGRHDFVWEATEAEFAKLLDTQRQSLARAGIPFESIPALAAQHLDDRDPTRKRGAHVMLTGWVLMQSTHHPDAPGRLIDFLPTHDFSVTITRADRGCLSVDIEARARDDFAGEA